MSGRWAARFRSITAYHDSVDTVDTVRDPAASAAASVSTVSIVSRLGKADDRPGERQSVNTVDSVTDGENGIEAAERAAIQREAELAVRQSIPNSTMVPGLMLASRWPR